MSSSPVIIITGGAQGIGAATAKLAAARGYAVCVNYQHGGEAAEHVVREIAGKGGHAIAVQADIGSETGVLVLYRQVDSRLGKVSALVNNAATLERQMRLDAMDAARIARTFAVNVLGSMICAREAVKRMSTRHGGSGGAIVNVSSGAAKYGSPGEYVDYAASKGAIETFTVGLASEVAQEGIRVNAVRPGFIYTELHAKGGEPQRVDRVKTLVPMQRGGQPEEVANAILWLLSEEASYVTGTIVDVSGGRESGFPPEVHHSDTKISRLGHSPSFTICLTPTQLKRGAGREGKMQSVRNERHKSLADGHLRQTFVAAMGALAILLAGFGRVAEAEALPAILCSSTSLSNGDPNPSCDAAGGGTVTEVTSSGTFFSSIDMSADPSLFATISDSPNFPYDAAPSASASGIFYFEVTGPAGHVPVLVVGNGTVSGTGTAGSLFEIDFAPFPDLVATTTILQDQVRCGLGCTGSPSFSQDGDLSIDANEPYLVTLQVTAQATGEFVDNTATATLDPVISIDPSFGQAGEYQLQFSPGFPSTSQAPEPAAFGELAIGLAGVMFIRRRKRLSAQARFIFCNKA